MSKQPRKLERDSFGRCVMLVSIYPHIKRYREVKFHVADCLVFTSVLEWSGSSTSNHYQLWCSIKREFVTQGTCNSNTNSIQRLPDAARAGGRKLPAHAQFQALPILLMQLKLLGVCLKHEAWSVLHDEVWHGITTPYLGPSWHCKLKQWVKLESNFVLGE